MNTYKQLLLVAVLNLASAFGAMAQVNITMWGVDHLHSQVNNQETILTPITSLTRPSDNFLLNLWMDRSTDRFSI